MTIRKARSSPLKVFGIGLNKTGTKTLGACLRQLGFRNQSYSGEALRDYQQGAFGPLFDIIERFDSFEDWPWPLMWRQVFEKYGASARYILTTRRSAEVWVESLKAHSLTTHPTRAMRPLIYGYYYPHGYEAEHKEAYLGHNSEVRAFFAREAPQAFLEVCWETGSSWPQLCNFLHKPIPDVPLPHERPRSSGVEEAVRAANLAAIHRQLADLQAGRKVVPRGALIHP